MSPSARVTVCLPAYNAGPFIKEAIDSVLAQTCSDWRLVIADNHSPDDTAAIARRYQDPRISFYQHEQNLGVAANWQFVLSKVETPYFCLLGADDYFYPQHLEAKLRLLDEFPEASLVHSAVDIIDAEGKHLRVYREPFSKFEPTSAHFPKFFQRNFVNIAGALVRMEPVRRLGTGFDPRFSILCDWHFYMVLLLLTPGFAYDEKVTSVYRRHVQSVASQTEATAVWIREQTELHLAVLKEHREACSALLDTDAMARKVTQDLWRPAIREWLRGNRRDAAGFWRLFRTYHSLATLVVRAPQFAAHKIHNSVSKP